MQEKIEKNYTFISFIYLLENLIIPAVTTMAYYLFSNLIEMKVVNLSYIEG